MPIALAALAWLLVMTGINGNYSAVGSQFETDVFNNGKSGGFINFMAGILGIAIFFRVIGLPTVGRAFLILALLVFILQNPNVLTALESIGGGSSTPTASGSTAPTTPTAGGSAPIASAPINTPTGNGNIAA